MPHQTRTVRRSTKGRYKLENGRKVHPPEGWELLPPGDGTLTRRVKKAGPHWLVIKKKRKRRTQSLGVLAPAETIARERKRLAAERATPEYKRRLEASRRRARKKQQEYVEDFKEAVVAFLDFPKPHHDVARALAGAVAEQSTAVGSGTVARTKRIPIAERAEAATVAWMRHHTTNYDTMKIRGRKGGRRAVRRQLAEQSRRLLDRYRAGKDIDRDACPLAQALGERLTGWVKVRRRRGT